MEQTEILGSLQVKAVPASGQRGHKRNVRWLRCAVNRATLRRSKDVYVRPKEDDDLNTVEMKVNEDNFIIIPIMESHHIYSILSPPPGPIALTNSNIRLLSVHSVRDGSLIDVTLKTSCMSLDNSTVTCPNSPSSDSASSSVLSEQASDTHVVLSMLGWQKMLRVPVEIWRSADWRLVFQGPHHLKWISGWRAPDRSGGCQALRQRTRIQLVGRLMMKDESGSRIYYGERKSEPYPLINFTPHLGREHVKLSKKGLLRLHLAQQHILVQATSSSNSNSVDPAPSSDIRIENGNWKITLERVTLASSEVHVTDLQVTCVHMLNVSVSRQSQPGDWWSGRFRRLLVEQRASRTGQQRCYLRVRLVFSDGSLSELLDYANYGASGGALGPAYRLLLLPEASDWTAVDVTNTDRFLYVPANYGGTPGRFSLELRESSACAEGGRLIFRKRVDLYGGEPGEETAEHKVVTPSIRVAEQPNSRGMMATVSQNRTSLSSNGSGKRRVDTDSLYLAMKILIGLVILVAVVIVCNCVIKFRSRKMLLLQGGEHGGTLHSGGGVMTTGLGGGEKTLVTSTYSPMLGGGGGAMTGTNDGCFVSQHPPLLPPPGPLYPALGDNPHLAAATDMAPDVFWGQQQKHQLYHHHDSIRPPNFRSPASFTSLEPDKHSSGLGGSISLSTASNDCYQPPLQTSTASQPHSAVDYTTTASLSV